MTTDMDLAQLLNGLKIASRYDPTTRQQSLSEDNLNHSNDFNAAGATKLARRNPHHEISFEYPVKSLTPAEAELFLPEPTDVEYREKPNRSKFHLDGRNLEYRLTVDPGEATSTLSAAHREVGQLVATIDRLSQSPGRTMMSVTSFVLNDAFHCRLIVQSFPQSGDVTFHQEYDLYLDESEELFTITSRAWIRLLSDLISRTSDRAYLYVHSRLRQEWGDEIASADKEQWRDLWASKSTRSAVHLFWKRLLDPETEERATLMKRDIEPFPVKLPCGHLLWTTQAEIVGVSADVASTATCVKDDCHQRIMQESDDAELEMRRELLRRDEAEQEDEAWNDLDLADLTLVRYAVPVYLLPEVLVQCGRSLDVPRSVTPVELSLLHCEETVFAMRTLEAWVAGREDIVQISSSKLYSMLKSVVKAALHETSTPGLLLTPTPVGWWDFFDGLLKRAIMFLMQRGCNDGSEEHDGMHYHEGSMFYNCLDVEARLMLAAGESEEAVENKLSAMAEAEDRVMEDLGSDE